MSNTKLPMGHILVSVYRSWSYTQRLKIEEFKSDDGIPYWYNRESGQTFWEKPLVEEEMISPLEGGTILDPNHSEHPFIMSKGEPHQSVKYNQGDVRKNMLMHHETEDEATRRRRNASTSAKVARQKGKLPDVMEGVSRIANESSTINETSLSSPKKDSPKKEKSSPKKIPQLSIDGSGKHNQSLPSPAGSDSSKISTESSLMSHQQEKLLAKQYSSGLNQSSIREDDEIRSENSFGDNDSNQPSNGLDPNVVQNLAVTLGQMISQMDIRNAKPQDMIQLGLGMGMALMQQTMTNNNHNNNNNTNKNNNNQDHPLSPTDIANQQNHVSFMDDSSINSLSVSTKGSIPNQTGIIKGQPIGIAKPSLPGVNDIRLNHNEENQQKKAHKQLENANLTSMEEALEIKVQPSATPDELQEGKYYQGLGIYMGYSL